MMVRFWVLLLAAASLAACHYRPPDNGQPQQVAQDRSGNVYTFGEVDQVSGTRFFTLPILRVDGSANRGSFSSGGGSNEEHNRLIVDSATGQSRPVLPDNSLEIVNWIEPTFRPSNLGVGIDGGESTDKSSGLYTAVVKRPGKTDKDPATYDILFGHFEDRHQAWIARGLSGVQAVWLRSDGKLAVVAAMKGHGTYQVYDPQSFRPLLESDLKIQ